MSVLSNPIFHDEKAAYEYVESILWPDGPICPKCGVLDNAYILNGKRARTGLRRCKDCKKDFTVKVGTVFESSHIKMHQWLQAVYLLSASKKGFSAHQLHRMLGCTYKTAWFMFHRLREAMREGNLPIMGGYGKTVEADETFIGKKYNKPKGARGYAHKEAVLSLVERGGRVRSRHIEAVSAEKLKPILWTQIHEGTKLMTDEAKEYRTIGRMFAGHETVQHGIGEYVRGGAHTNTVEGYFSIFKRGMKGVYQHCSSKHLKRYLSEFDFRYNEREVSDQTRMGLAIAGIVGKRLTYR